MQLGYRAIFAEALLAQSAAIETFVDAAVHCALLAAQQYQQALMALAGKIPTSGETGASTHPGVETAFPGAPLANLANLSRALAGLPRVSTLIFLSRYDDLRGRRGVARE